MNFLILGSITMNRLPSNSISKDIFFRMVAHNFFEDDEEISFDHTKAYKWLKVRRSLFLDEQNELSMDSELMDDEVTQSGSDLSTSIESDENDPKAEILKSNRICGASDYQEFFEEIILMALDNYVFSYEITSEDLFDYFNWVFEQNAKEGENIGLYITKMNISKTDIFLEDDDHGIIDENCPDFLWNGLVKLPTGQIIKLSVEAFYYLC